MQHDSGADDRLPTQSHRYGGSVLDPPDLTETPVEDISPRDESYLHSTHTFPEADAMEILESYVSVDLTMGKLSSFQLE